MTDVAGRQFRPLAVISGQAVDRIEDSPLWKLLNQPLGDFLWGMFGVILALAVLVWLIIRIRAWFRDDDDPAVGDHELLTSIRDLRREGDLTEDEYRSIKSRLVERLDDPTDPSG